jgi:predicted transcriptional regulator
LPHVFARIEEKLKYLVSIFVTPFSRVTEMEKSREHRAELHSVPIRSRIEIMANILNETRLSPEGLRKTRLMYKCNLSFRQLKVYLKLMREKRFLSVTALDCGQARANNGAEVEVYHVTEEGLSFLKAYNDLRLRLREELLHR